MFIVFFPLEGQRHVDAAIEELAKEISGETEGGRSNQDLDRQPQIETDMLLPLHHLFEIVAPVMGVRCAPRLADQIGNAAGKQGRNDGVELDAADGQDLEREDRAGQRCTGSGAETDRDAGRQYQAAIAFTQLEP